MKHAKSIRHCIAAAILTATLAPQIRAQAERNWAANYGDGVNAFRAGRYQESVKWLAAASQQAGDFPAGDVRRPQTQAVLAMAFQFTGQISQAEKLFREAKSSLEGSREQQPVLLAFTLDGLGELYHQHGDLQQADQLLRRAVDLCASSSGAGSACAITALRHLGELQAALNHMAEAERLLQQDVDVLRKNPDIDPAALATALRNLAGVYLLQARYKTAEPLFEESLKISSGPGQASGALADSLVGMARLRRLEHDPDRALPLLNRAVRIYESTGDTSLATSLHELGLVSIDTGKFATARSFLERSLDLTRRTQGPDIISIAFIQVALAQAYLGEGNDAEAAALIDKAMAMERAALPESHYELARCHMVAAEIDERQHRSESAGEHYRKALDIYRRSLRSDNPDLAQAEQQYARFSRSHPHE